MPMSANDEQFVAPDAAALANEAAALDPAYSPAQGAVAAEQPPGGAAGGAWEVLARRREELMGMEGVVMVGIGSNEIGDPAIVVGVKRPDQLRKLPSSLDGLPVRPQLIGEVDAYASPGKRRK
jgi:hypothetical protein